MRRLFFIVVLLGLVYVFGKIVVAEIQIFINEASVILSDTDKKAVQIEVRTYVNREILNPKNQLKDTDTITITTAHINTDTQKDIIAKVESDATCGTGGCMTIILLKNDLNEFKPIPFQYTVKSLKVENSITNGMHDLRINDNKNSYMTWNGEQYVLNSI